MEKGKHKNKEEKDEAPGINNIMNDEFPGFILESIPDAVFLTDTEGNFTFVCSNINLTLGYSDKEVLSKGNLRNLITDFNLDLPKLHTEKIIRNIPGKFRNKDGSLVDMLITVREIEYRKKLLLFVCRDITREKENLRLAAEKESFMENIADHVPGFLYRVRMDTTGKIEFLYISKGVKELCGYEPGEVMAKSNVMVDHIHPDDRELFYSKIGESYQNLTPYLVQHRIIDTNGRIRWLDAASTPSRMDDGSVIWNGIATDITELKLREQELEESEQKFRKFFNEAPLAIILAESESGIIKDANAKAVELFERPVEEFPGMHQSEMHPGEVDDQSRETFNKRPQAPGFEEVFTEIDILTKTGKRKTVEISASEVLIREKPHLLGFFRDITAQKKVENALIESEEKFQQLAHNISDVFWLSDPLKGEIIYISPSIVRLWGDYPPTNSVRLEEFHNYVHPDDMHLLREHYEDPEILFNQEIELEFRIFRKDKTGIWVKTKTFPVRDAEGNTFRIAGILSDVTERKKMEEDLKRALDKAMESDRLKTAFLHNMTHELRTPMNGIIGFTDLLVLGGVSLEKSEHYLSLIRKSGERLLDIVNDILEISKIQSGEIETRPSEFQISELMEDLYSFFEPEANKNKLGFILDIPEKDKILRIHSDRQKIYHILMNLVKNSLKYTDIGEIRFGYRSEKNRIRFYVKDTGIGISQIHLDRIFESFYQVDDEPHKIIEGTGLGLAISKNFVEALGGKMNVDSIPGKGSEFSFSIPLKAFK